MLPDIVGMIMQGGRMNLYILSGLSMIIVGIGFKLAWVPFHMWAADVYQGSPAPVTASLATVSKIAIFALLLRYFHGIPVRNYPALFWIFTLFAGFSMIIGNWLALMQRNVKRLLAYSSIAHFGYMLLPFLAGGQGGEAAVLFYLTAYTIATLGNFGVITILSDPGKETENWEEFSGLMWRRPALAAVFVLMILSLAGIPATIGFVGKIYMLFAGIDSALWALSILLVVGTSISFFYYLKLVILQFARGAADGQVQSGSGSAGALSATFSEGVVMAVLVGLLVVLGVYPTPLIRLIQLMVKVIG
jgi:NADH-quinone oxidoreductase subunit N